MPGGAVGSGLFGGGEDHAHLGFCTGASREKSLFDRGTQGWAAGENYAVSLIPVAGTTITDLPALLKFLTRLDDGTIGDG